MGVACCDSSVAPPDDRMVPKKGVVARKHNPLEAGMQQDEDDMMMDGEISNDDGVAQKAVLGYWGFRGLA